MFEKIFRRSLFVLLILLVFINADEKGVTPYSMNNIPDQYTVNVGKTYRVYFNVPESRIKNNSQYCNSNGSLKSEFDLRITTRNGTKKLNTDDSKYWYKDFTRLKVDRIFHTFRMYRNNENYQSFGGIEILVSEPITPPTLNLKLKNDSISLSWNSVSRATMYKLLRSTSPNGSYTTLYCGSLTNYTDSKDNLTIGKRYYYKVKAGPSSASCHLDTYWSQASDYKSIQLTTSGSSENISRGIFDGAGSLISPNEECYGCNKDIAKMHPHSGFSSTVVFQWKYDSSTCKHLDITSDRNVEVVIKSKTWNDQITRKAFQVKLGTTPISLKRPTGSNWLTFAVTSTKPITKGIEITAKCSGVDAFYSSLNETSAKKELVNLKNNYVWTGTGSLITGAEAGTLETVGIGNDYAITFSDKKSLTSFQWYATEQCSTIKIGEAHGKSTSTNGVYIKGWAEEYWSANKCGSSLPCTITAPSIDRYHIIKIKSDFNAIPSRNIKAFCSDDESTIDVPPIFYGAIAYDNYYGVIGYSYRFLNQLDAENKALSACREKNGENCKIVKSEGNTCMALARNSNADAGWSSNQSFDQARQEALNRCYGVNNVTCTVATSFCTNGDSEL